MSNIRLVENLNGNMEWKQELDGVTVASTSTIRFYVYTSEASDAYFDDG